MTFKNALKLFITIPFAPKKYWKTYVEINDPDSKMPVYVLLMFLFWYFIFYTQVYVPPIIDNGIIIYIYLFIPTLIHVFGLVYTTRIATKIVLQEAFDRNFYWVLVSFSAFPIFVVFIINIITNYWHWYFNILIAAWSAFVMFFGFKLVKGVAQSKAISIVIAAQVLIYVITYLFSRFVLSELIFSF